MLNIYQMVCALKPNVDYEQNVAWTQAFFDGNRRTGIIAAGKFLHDNGYELDIDPEDENLELRHMLSEIKKQSQTLNQDIMKQMYFYISKRIRPL